MNLVGACTLTLRKDYFSSLLRAITGQQLSVQVARTIWSRITRLCADIEPQAILSLADEDLRGVGISKRKVLYMKPAEPYPPGQVRAFISLSDIRWLYPFTQNMVHSRCTCS
ncbi:hypothetical protein [Pelotomaculum propionicicum]|nr:hypothetical protein [Pelotomaculum propionicicum]NLI12139.1 hypothetical protein [Peptococcaceae bacterium]